MWKVNVLWSVREMRDGGWQKVQASMQAERGAQRALSSKTDKVLILQGCEKEIIGTLPCVGCIGGTLSILWLGFRFRASVGTDADINLLAG
jgi:hypothetical protein